MRRLTLHIGSHKTGTTTLQETFLLNKTLLASRGVGYAHRADTCQLHGYLSVIDPASLLTQGFGVRDLDRFADDLAATQGQEVFGSSENFSFFFQQAPIDALAKALRSRFDAVQILVYIRRQDRHALSHYQEGARPGRAPEAQLWGHGLAALPPPQPHHALYLNYHHRLAMWERAFDGGTVTVRVYDRKLLKNGDIAADVLDVLGISAQGIVPVPDKNPALGLQQAKVGHLAGEILDNDPLTRALLRALPQDEGKMLPSADEAKAFLAPYRASNRLLNERLGLTPFPDLFPDDFDDYPETAQDGWSDATATSALRAVIGTLGKRKTVMEDLTADDLRKAALVLRNTDPSAALRLVRAAHLLRPNGAQINQMKCALEAQLRDPDAL